MEGLARTGIAMLVAALAFSAPLAGTFALEGGTQKVSSQMNLRQTPTKTTLDIYQTPEQSSKPILKYTLDMTKPMHLVLISDDFTQFMHEHPAFNPKTGHFTITLALDPTRQYIAYADTIPAGAGQQVFRYLLPAQQTIPVTVPAGQPTNRPVFASTPSPATANVGPYTVKLQSTTLSANAKLAVPITIERSGKLATNLKPYLGAAAHAVFIDTANLNYIHVHPMVQGSSMKMNMAMNDKSAAQSGPRMVMELSDLPVGTYKMWLEFQGGSKLYTAPFTIAVR